MRELSDFHSILSSFELPQRDSRWPLRYFNPLSPFPRPLCLHIEAMSSHPERTRMQTARWGGKQGGKLAINGDLLVSNRKSEGTKERTGVLFQAGPLLNLSGPTDAHVKTRRTDS